MDNSQMDTIAFRKSLEADGYTVIERDVSANSSLDEHDHAWAVKAMVTAGSFYVNTKDLRKTYTAGEVFSLEANEQHTEGAGDEGASLLIGRK